MNSSLLIPLSIVLLLVLTFWYRKIISLPLQKLLLFMHQLLMQLNISSGSHSSIPASGQSIDQLAIEQRLITEKEHLLAVLRGMKEGVMVTDKDGRVILVNPAFRKMFSFEGPVEGKTSRRDFVANVSHELRTPLTSILGYTETLLNGTLSDRDTAQNFMGIIQKHAQRLAAIVEDLLTISQIESHQLDLTFQPLSLADCAREVLNTIERACEEKGLKLINRLSPALPKVWGDKYRIEQILLNLLDNAVKYTTSPGSITISARSVQDMVEIAISDTGIGIPEKDLSRIFERFYRVDKARSRKLGGTDLGLSIVKHLVQAHNGKVWAESEEGRGSSFYFTLPKAS